MLFKEIVDARTHAGRRTLKDHKSSLEHFVLRWAKKPLKKNTKQLNTVNTPRYCVLIKYKRNLFRIKEFAVLNFVLMLTIHTL